MISQYRFKVPDTESLSDLRTGGRQLGVRLVRDLVRGSDDSALLERARDGVRELLDEVASIARDDATLEEQRGKAAEFIVHLRGRERSARALSDVVNGVAEAAARARYRSGRIVDFVSFWLFVLGESFIRGVGDDAARLELESEHPQAWNRFRGELLELLEAGSERLNGGRRFRLAEGYLARFRLVRARFDEQLRIDARTAPSAASAADVRTPDYVATMVVDLFALSLSDLQQRLVIAQIPNATSAKDRKGFSADEQRRLWTPLRAVRPDQAFTRWPRLVKEAGVTERLAVQEFCRGLAAHLQRGWNWFFPDRRPFGTLRTALLAFEHAVQEGRTGESVVRDLFDLYASTLSFIARLATEDAESSAFQFDGEEAAGGSF